MGSSAKTGKKFFRGSQDQFLHESAIWDRNPLPTHQMQSTCVREDSPVTNLQTELNYLNLFKSYCNSSNLGFLSSGGGGGAGRWGVSGVINYSLYEFRNVQR